MNNMNKVYWKTKIHMICLALVIIGSINWGTTALGWNLVEILNSSINQLVGMNIPLNKVIYILVALAAIKLAIKRDNWLQFLGNAVLPGSLIPLKQNKGDTVVEIKVRPNSRIAYWASLPSDEKTPEVNKAYGDYSNSGVVMSDEKGIAKLTIQKGTDYIVPSGRVIKRHVHYRELDQAWGMVGPVKTKKY